jgi:F-type H+-transporting ATPase subunit gamma
MEKVRRRFMSKLSDLQSRMRSLRDIAAILNAMKNLSLVEIAKISRFYVIQQELSQTIESALADFQQFYGVSYSPAPPSPRSLYVLIGSERGFCGGFNEAVQKELEGATSEGIPTDLIVVGRKLALKFLEDKRVIASLDGPGAAEEIPLVISQLAKELTRSPESRWKIIHNSYKNGETHVETTCPFEFSQQGVTTPFRFPPLINLAPSQLLPQLFEQYLFALFYGVFYLSFIAENHERLRHMDGALNRISEEEQRLGLLANALRQESITEELEIIMLNTGNPNYRSR